MNSLDYLNVFGDGGRTWGDSIVVHSGCQAARITMNTQDYMRMAEQNAAVSRAQTQLRLATSTSCYESLGNDLRVNPLMNQAAPRREDAPVDLGPWPWPKTSEAELARRARAEEIARRISKAMLITAAVVVNLGLVYLLLRVL